MSDVLCDSCHRAWTADEPMIEGHHGSCLCGTCLTLAYTEVVLNGSRPATGAYRCPMCLEERPDREALGRADEPGWRSPFHEEAVICKRCIEMAAESLDRDRDFDWKMPR
jgi:hypothetical protein